MAELNFGLLNTNLPGEIAGSVQRGRDEAVREQAAQQQLKTGALQQENIQMQLEQAKRDRDALAKMQAAFVANGKSPDLESNFDEMIKSGISHYVDIGIQGKQKLIEQKRFASIMGGDIGAPQAPAAVPFAAAPTNTLAPSAAAPSVAAPINALAPSVAALAPAAPVNNLATPQSANSDVAVLRRKRDMLLAMGTTQSIAAARAIDADIALASKDPVYHVVPNVGLVDPRTGRVITPSTESAPTTVKEYEYAKQQGYKGSLFDFKREMALAGRPPGQPRAEQPPVAVVDPVTGKPVYVTREQAMGMTPASAMESLPPKEIQRREAALPQATSFVKSIEFKSDQFIKELEKLRDDEGLDQITGPVYGRTPSVGRAGSRAQSTYDKIFAKGGFQALQDMREASKTGGALGNVSNEEGRRLEKSIVGGLDRTQNIADVKQGINDLIDEIRVSKTRVREAYDSTYSYKSGGGAPAAAAAAAPAPAPAPNIDALLNKYK